MNDTDEPIDDGEEEVWLDLSEAEEGVHDPAEDEEWYADAANRAVADPITTRTPVPTRIAKRIRDARLMTVRKLRELPPVEWFVEGLIPAGPRTLLHGPGGSKKSFLMLDWMLCASTRTPWHGRTIAPGRVLYIVGEGVSGLGKRLDAWLATHPGANPNLPEIAFMPQPVNLYTLTDSEIELWHDTFELMGFTYIVVDTVHQSMAGGEENSAADIGKVLENASKIAGRADLFFIHHDPKAAREGPGNFSTPRGSSALRDSVDVCLTMAPHKTDNLAAVLKPDKVRDAEPFKDQHLRFGVHGEGIQSSLYIASVDDGAPKGEVKQRLELSEEARFMLQWMKKHGRRSSRWMSAAAVVTDCSGMSTNRKKDGLRELCQMGLVTKVDGIYQIAANPEPAE